jgi:hypothetical protein
MRNSLSMRAARASVAATLFFSLNLAPAFAHMASLPRGGAIGRMALAHGQPFRLRNFNPNGFRHLPFDERRRFARNGLRNNAGIFGCCGWGGWGGWSAPSTPPIVVSGDSAPVVINFSPPVVGGDIGGAFSGGCVIHKLDYNREGKFIGERQFFAC